MKRFFKWLLLLVAVIAVGMTVLIYNPGLVKGPLERYLSNLAGFSITVEGELHIETGRVTELSADNIRIAAPEWSTRTDLVTINQLRLSLDITTVFDDIVVVSFLQIDDLQLNLEVRADGTNNWTRTDNLPSGAEGRTTHPVIVFDTVQVTNTLARYKDDKRGREQVLYIETLNQIHEPGGSLSINLDGSLNNNPVGFKGTIGPYANLVQGHDISFAGAGNFGKLHIEGKGLIDDIFNPRRPQFELDMQGPNVDDITSMLQVDDLGSGGFFLAARGKDLGDHYEAGINGKIGDVALDVSVQATDFLALQEIDLEVAINGPSLGAFTRVFGIKNWPDKPFSLKGNATRIGSVLNISGLTLGIGGTKLTLEALLSKFPDLDASRVRLSIVGDDISQFRELVGIHGVATGPFEVQGKLDVSPQEVELLQLELKTSLGQLTLSGTLGTAPTYTGSQLHLHLDGHNARSLMSVFGIKALPEKPFNLDTQVQVVENGMFLSRGVLVTIEDERLEVDGFISFEAGGVGSDFRARLKGQHLAQMVHGLVDDSQVPDTAYEVSGRIHLTQNGIELQDTKAEYADISLSTAGFISLPDAARKTELEFNIKGNNFSTLNKFEAIGDSLDFFVPGQAYQISGHFLIDNSGWSLKNIKGQIGTTDIDFDSWISNQPGWSGANISFLIKGPDFHSFLIDRDDILSDHFDQLIGPFESSGQVSLSGDKLSINNMAFKTAKTHGEVDLELFRPINNASDAVFRINLRGNDIQQLIPETGMFETEIAAYHVKADGQKRGNLISLKHFDADVGSLRLALEGEVNQSLNDEVSNITFRATSNDISTLGQLNGKALPAMALNLKGDYQGNIHEFALHNLSGTLGKSDITGNLEINLRNPKPKINLVAQSNLLDLHTIMEATGTDYEKVIDSTQERMIPATPLPLDTLAATDSTIKLKVAELRYRSDSFKNVDIEAETSAGNLDISKLSLEAPRGKLESSFSIYPTGNNQADVNINLSAEGLVFNFSGLPSDKLLEIPAVDVNFQAFGQGSNLRELAGSLNGDFYLGSKGGSMKDFDVSMLDPFIITKVTNLIMPKTDKNNDLSLSCVAAKLKLTDGLVTTDPVVTFIADRFTLISKGNLNLKTEKLKLNFNATPNKALKISGGELFNPYILVGGTLSNPVVGLDPAKALIHGGAAVGTAGVSILAKGLWDRISNTVPLCEKMLIEAQQKE